jgi:hypothetical protein
MVSLPVARGPPQRGDLVLTWVPKVLTSWHPGHRNPVRMPSRPSRAPTIPPQRLPTAPLTGSRTSCRSGNCRSASFLRAFQSRDLRLLRRATPPGVRGLRVGRRRLARRMQFDPLAPTRCDDSAERIAEPPTCLGDRSEYLVYTSMSSQVAGRKRARAACPARRDEMGSPRRLPCRTMP